MKSQFIEFLDNIKLTDNQISDAKTKYDGVCEKLHSSYYDTKYNGDTKLLFGSYRNRTNVRPIIPTQDVDVLFILPPDDFAQFKKRSDNGPSALLARIREILKEKYTTTEVIRAWGKVVVVEFADGTHNIEVLPGNELSNGKFEIPNTENGGRWELFDPREQIQKIKTSNTNTEGLTIDLCRMMKTWKRQITTLGMSSFQLENHVLSFLTGFRDIKQEKPQIVLSFFEYLRNVVPGTEQTHCETAITRAKKALEFIQHEDFAHASEEYRKIFGPEFPLVIESNSSQKQNIVESKPIHKAPAPWSY